MLVRVSLLCVGLLLVGLTAARAETMTYIYHPPESDEDVRYKYHWEILRAALERTVGTYGAYEMKPSARMNERRQARSLKTGQHLTVMVHSANPRYEEIFTPVRIPLDKGLIGYRMLLINRADQPVFDTVKNLEDLRRLTVGQGQGWSDVAVWKANGFNVVEGVDYNGLFKMLLRGRFDFFSRSIIEIGNEYTSRKDEMPELQIERSIAVYYPWPFYLYFPNSDIGRRLAMRAKEGLLALFDDNQAFDAIFLKHHGEMLRRVDLKHRKKFRLDNPLLTPETPLNDRRFWFDPLKH